MHALLVGGLLVAQVAAPTGASDYRAQCADLAKKNQLKPGLSVHECAAQLAAADAPPMTKGEATRVYFAAGVPEFGADSKLSFDLLALAVLIEYWHPLNQQRQMMVFYLRRVGSRWQWRMEEGLREKLRKLAEQTRNEKPRPSEVSASEAYAASARWDDVAESQQAPLEAAYQLFVREHPQGTMPVSEREKNREKLMLWKPEAETPAAPAPKAEQPRPPAPQVEQPVAAATKVEQPPATPTLPKRTPSHKRFNWGGLLIVSLLMGYLLVGVMWVRSVRRLPPPILGSSLSLPQAYDLHIMTGPRIATAGPWTLFDYIQHVALWPRLEYRSYQFQLQAVGVNRPQTALAATISVALKRVTAETLCVAAVIALPVLLFSDDQFWIPNGIRLVAVVLWTPLTVVVGLVISPVFWVVHFGIEPVLRLFVAPSTRE